MSITLEQEQQLVQKAQTDPDAFGEIYDCYYPQILRYIARRVFDYDTAYDITANTFYKAFCKIKDFKWQNISIAAWLYRIASNEIKKHYRKFSIFKQVNIADIENFLTDPESADSEIKAAQEELEKNDQAKKLHQYMKQLKENYHQFLILRYWEKKSLKEIAEIFGKNENNVKIILHRATKKLKKIMSS
jgi:RNA polymerase sigma-70 factor (ECF subfamily)